MPHPHSNGQYDHVRRTAPTHITWAKIRTYTTTYTPTGRKPKTQQQSRRAITIRTVSRPKKVRYFRSGTGLKKYKAAHTTTTLREVIIVAKTKSRKKPVDADEIEELEAIEELEELEDEDLEDVEDEEEPDEEEDEDEDDEEDEAPPKRRTKGKAAAKTSTKSKTTKGESRAKANGKVGTQELAAHLDIDGRTLRIVLRKHSIQVDPESKRYEWDDFDDPEVKKIIKLVKGGEAKRAKQESLDKLKAKKTAQREEAQKAKGKKGKRSKVVETEALDEDEDLDDEVEDDDIEEEEIEAPKPKRRRAKK